MKKKEKAQISTDNPSTVVHSHSNKSSGAIWINQAMDFFETKRWSPLFKIYFGQKLLLAMLKSLKGILVYVYFAMSPWNMIVLS